MIQRLWRPSAKPAKPLYVFAHLPKTAGSTFRKHLRANFAPEEILEIYIGEELPSQEAIERYVGSLSSERRAKIRVILGHHVYFGIHRFFAREPRRIIFLRNPVARTISHYNYCRTDHAHGEKNHYPPIIAEDGAVLPFESWFNRNPTLHNFMTQYLVRYYRRRVSDPGAVEADLQAAREILSRFYFVGLTERYSEDAPYLYHELGISKFFGKENVSAKHFEPEPQAIEMVRAKCRRDAELYGFATELNARFRREHKDFERVVKGMKARVAATAGMG